MALDLTKLTPAPWRYENGYVYKPNGNPLLMPEVDDAEGWAALEFAALARNAFSVMFRRGWYAVFLPSGKWGICSNGMAQRLPFDLWEQWKGFIRDDPFSVLVEADKWLTEQERKEV